MLSAPLLLLGGCIVSVLGQVTSYSCKNACGSAIQVDEVIECYCHAACVIEVPGKCCDDFDQQCPGEHSEGQELLAAEEEKMGATILPNMPPGCELPDSNVIPVPSKTYNWEQSGETCAGHCGSLMVDNEDELMCFCDSGCLLTADCCVDFVDTCAIDPCILALVMPAAPEEDAEGFITGSCLSSCGEIVPGQFAGGFCSCESACVEDGSCCPDFPEMCPAWVDQSIIPVKPEVKDGSCFGKCGVGSGECWCDYQCVANGDCCDDYEGMCGATFGLIVWTGNGSCHKKCGGAGFDCWCDETCVHAGDCCDDYLDKCKAGKEGSCEGSCGGFGGGCWCDAKCKQMGDCCDDQAAVC